jgi:hypothetical protein
LKKSLLKQINEMYKGYSATMAKKRITLYNPDSIMECIRGKGRLDYYWNSTGGLPWTKRLMFDLPQLTDIADLINGKTLTLDL